LALLSSTTAIVATVGNYCFLRYAFTMRSTMHLLDYLRKSEMNAQKASHLSGGGFCAVLEIP
jgi:hypothetical protein